MIQGIAEQSSPIQKVISYKAKSQNTKLDVDGRHAVILGGGWLKEVLDILDCEGVNAMAHHLGKFTVS